MINPWRAALQSEIRRRYIHEEPTEWCNLTVSPSGLVNLSIVSDAFSGLTYPERTAHVQALIREHHTAAEIGFLTLYTIDEAKALELAPPPRPTNTEPGTWHELALWAANSGSAPLNRSRPAGRARTIAFYSFKGGVGRTTALIHVAAALARLGRKVVAVDLDLEAPGLGSAVTLREPHPSRGIVDFFYDRLYRPANEASLVDIPSVVGEVELQAPGRFLVVPAGELSLDYVAKLDDLRAAATTRRGDDLWASFARDLTRHVDPDVILVDSRTGINQWGALSLLRAADELVVFLYPNDQNRQGISLLLQSLAGLGTPTHVVFSPVPATDGPGMDRVRDQWRSLQLQLTGEPKPTDRQVIREPLVVPYLNQVALADRYPTESVVYAYQQIANQIDAGLAANRIAEVLESRDQALILESLPLVLPDEGIRRRNHLPWFYQTPDFRRFLDSRTCIIRGQVGAGKSTLYRLCWDRSLMLSERTAAVSFRSLLIRRLGPTAQSFHRLHDAISAAGATWTDFWRLLSLHAMTRQVYPRPVRSSKELEPDTPDKMSKYSQWSLGPKWGPTQIRVISDILSSADNRRDMMQALVEISKERKASTWLLMDGLDEMLPEQDSLREAVLKGLLDLIKQNDLFGIDNIHYKIFVQEATWSSLPSTVTAYFTGRDVQLDWTYRDFLGLVRQLALASELYQRVEFDVGRNAEANPEHSLQILWGSRLADESEILPVSRWIAHEMSDAAGNLYPGSIIRMLQVARQTELALRSRSDDHPPKDRLLRPESLQAGITAAAIEHAQRVAQAFPRDRELFDQLHQMRASLSLSDASRFSKSEFIDLIRAGIARVENDQLHFGRIYIHGFQMKTH